MDTTQCSSLPWVRINWTWILEKFSSTSEVQTPIQKREAFPQSRSEWCTPENVKEMYIRIYDQLVESGIAEKLEEGVYMDKDGNEVEKEKAFGLKVNHKLVHPDYFIHVDEFGDNIDMTGDKSKGGERFVVGKNAPARTEASTSNCHYTVLGFTASTGDPVMCAIIVTGKDLGVDDGVQLNISTGIDVLADEPIDINNIENSFKEGGALSGGPTCVFRGKTVPCYVTTSKKEE